ncbi:MAG: sodium:proton antiporter, partial [Pseudomonadota bacterium]|nr:sodium:proton antiporter [Pseudomonadota bacterium]
MTAGAAATQAALDVLPGADLGLAWALPFAALLLSIALLPLLAPSLWHRHYGKVALAWCAMLVIPLAVVHGVGMAMHEVMHALLIEFVPFISLLFALFVIAGGIGIHGGRLAGTPWRNTALLLFGSAIASVIGTTGAAMVLIRPLLEANAHRLHRAHTVVFFILLVANVGGALSPLGDPPLFVGFLKGIDFFWPLRHLAGATAFLAAALLVLHWFVDATLARRENVPAPSMSAPFALEGRFNLALLCAVIGVVLGSGVWQPGIAFEWLGQRLELQNVARDAALIILAVVSLRLTPAGVRAHNAFTFAPIAEVAKLFAALFVTIAPVIAVLQAGPEGAFASVIALVRDANGAPRDAAIFIATGALSAYLDNAPTYLVFFNLFGGDAVELMNRYASTLAAISMAAVYCGALTYIGNAPNLMVKAIAEGRGIRMPGFFAYFAWALLLMVVPLGVIVA